MWANKHSPPSLLVRLQNFAAKPEAAAAPVAARRGGSGGVSSTQPTAEYHSSDIWAFLADFCDQPKGKFLSFHVCPLDS